jgi:hypothetical protein
MPIPDFAPTAAVQVRPTRSRVDAVVVIAAPGSSLESAYRAVVSGEERTSKLDGDASYQPTHTELGRRIEEKEMRLHLAAAVMGEAYADLMADRNALVSKHFAGGLSKAENRRLELLRWKLDQIDENRMGNSLQKMLPLTEMHDQLAASVQGLVDRLAELRPNAVRGGRR